MSHPDPDRPSPRRARHRARHDDAAPGAYPELDQLPDPLPGGPAAGRAPGRVHVDPSGEDWQAAPDPWHPDAEERRRAPALVRDPVEEPAARVAAAEATVRPASRAGRDLPAAIGVGVGLAAAVLLALFVWKPAFLGVLVLAIGVGTWEMARAVRAGELRPPYVPLLLGGPVMVGLAWFGGAEALPYGLLGTVVATLVWRLGDGPSGYDRDTAAATLIAVYVPFLLSFAALLVHPDDGAMRVLVTFACVILSDTGGYAAGVFLGRHPMAPSVSPKKSWEGFAGSVAAAAVGSAVMLALLLDAAWWAGLVFGLAVAVASVLGDLAESLVKRDLGIKDMSRLLPGHGGLMDRLDSILFAVPVAYGVLVLVAPPV